MQLRHKYKVPLVYATKMGNFKKFTSRTLYLCLKLESPPRLLRHDSCDMTPSLLSQNSEMHLCLLCMASITHIYLHVREWLQVPSCGCYIVQRVVSIPCPFACRLRANCNHVEPCVA